MRLGLLAAVSCLLAAPAAHAQFAVFDAASVAQLVHEAQTLAQELSTARAQLSAAQLLYSSMSGTRGMQQLLRDSPTDTLPSDWSQLMAAMQGAGYGGALGVSVDASVAAHALLTDAQLAALPSAARTDIDAARRSVALLQALAQQGLADDGERLATLSRLTQAIGAAGDQKSILELQATIGAERGLLIDEQAKLQLLRQGVVSQRWAERQRDREAVIAGHGRFTERFEPSPP